MDKENPVQEYPYEDINSWTPEEVIQALANEFEPYANSIEGWAQVLSD